jgi:RNA polymerase sigma-70 factor (ECF subfamily)
MTQLLETCALNDEASDAQLMEMIQCGVKTGLEKLHKRHAGMLRALSMGILHNSADSEDLVQDVFVEIWNRASLYDPGKGQPLPWIATLTRRRSIDRLRKRECYNRFEERFTVETQSLGDVWTHVREDIVRREESTPLLRAMEHLPEAQRAVIRLAYHEQMTHREIASKTGIPLGTIKTRLQLGLRKLAVTLSALDESNTQTHPRATA